jgi:hypothetical protein
MSRKTDERKVVGVLKVNDENSRIRILTKMSWVRNTDRQESHSHVMSPDLLV